MSSAISQTLPLELLATGEQGTVIEVDGDPNLVIRLEEIGLHSGVGASRVPWASTVLGASVPAARAAVAPRKRRRFGSVGWSGIVTAYL